MTAMDIILSLNLILVYFFLFQSRKEIAELRKDVDRDIDIIETPSDEPNLWRTKDDHKTTHIKTN